MKKRCGGCGKRKAVAEFYKDPSTGDGLRRDCKPCDNERRNGSRITGNAPSLDKHTAVLLKLAKGKDSIDFGELCNKLDLSPAKAAQVIERARKLGINLEVAGNHVAIRPTEARTDVVQVGVKPVVGERQKVGVISDLHFGSKHCLRAQLVDAVRWLYKQGVREILCPGDVLDGIYRFSRFEQSHHGIDEQADDAIETLPQLAGLSYHSITGNHDETFWEAIGVDVGHYLEARFRRAGRADVHFYGNRGATVQVRGALVELWHPRGGGAYARSYNLQKKVEKYSPGAKPQIMLAGHWHFYCHVIARGIHALACPTFQGGGSSFGKSLGGAPDIGAMLLDWQLTADGTMRGFRHELRSYYELERPQRLDDRDPGIPVHVPGVRTRAGA